jgi:hypothetical protein
MALFPTFTSRNTAAPVAGQSLLERTLRIVPSLQESMGKKELRNLAAVSSTCMAVADDPYIWRKKLSENLNIPMQRLPNPIDGSARMHNDLSCRPYKQIIRGLRIIDGDRARNVPLDRITMEQRQCEERAANFLDRNIPNYLNAIIERHALYAISNNVEQSIAENVLVGATLTGVSVVVSGAHIAQGYQVLQYTPARMAQDAALSKMITILGFKATKVLLLYSSGFWTLKALSLTFGMGQFTYRQFCDLQVMWRERERMAAAISIQQKLAALRFQ